MYRVKLHCNWVNSIYIGKPMWTLQEVEAYLIENKGLWRDLCWQSVTVQVGDSEEIVSTVQL